MKTKYIIVLSYIILIKINYYTRTKYIDIYIYIYW